MGKALHQEVYDNRQSGGDFVEQARVTLVSFDYFRKSDDNPEARDEVAEPAWVSVHRHNHLRDSRKVGITIFWVNYDNTSAYTRYASISIL